MFRIMCMAATFLHMQSNLERSNRLNIENINQRQFDNTMLKEGMTVQDYYDSTKTYQVFFRRNNRGTTPQGKLRLFYAQNSGISIGTIFILNGENYL